MKSIQAFLVESINASIVNKRRFIENSKQIANFSQAVELVTDVYRRGGRVYVAGNGGSSSDSQHLVAEFVCKLSKPRAPLAAEALTADMATLTAIGNDFDFDEVFARQLQCKATECDVFIALSTSGQSGNLVRALERCRDLAIPSILFGGRGGGRCAELADVSVIVPGSDSCQVQELHIVLYHTLVACVESALFADQPLRDVADAVAVSAIVPS
jgi:D-sedoheptulose 7-phosphate isomerase